MRPPLTPLCTFSSSRKMKARPSHLNTVSSHIQIDSIRTPQALVLQVCLRLDDARVVTSLRLERVEA